MMIEEALSYYRDEVIPAITIAQTLEHGFPLPVANELRNALTHLARANALAGADRAEEVNLAKGHLKRICLDCYKISILNRAEEVDLLTRGIEQDAVALPNSVYVEIRALRTRRTDSGVQEGQRQPNGTVDELKTLLNDYDAMVCRLQSEFGGELARARSRSFWRKVLLNNGLGLTVGVLASWLATALGAFPPETDKVIAFLTRLMRGEIGTP